MMSPETILFHAFAGLAVVSAIAMVALVRNMVAGALCLLATMVSLAGIHLLLEAHLVAAVLLVLYSGAIAVLLLFIVMLVNVEDDDFRPPRPGQRLLKGVGIVGALGLGLSWGRSLEISLPEPLSAPPGFGGFRSIGLVLYTDFLVPLELVSVVLLAAIVGTVVLAKRRID